MNPNVRISALETKLKQRDAQIVKLRKELREARRYIHELTRPADAADDDKDVDMDIDEDGDDEEGDDEDGSEGEGEGEGEEEDEGELPEVLLFNDVYVCSSCGTEVLEGVCHGYWCGIKHQWPPEEELDEEYSVITNSLAIHPDRSLVPRGDTPVSDIDASVNPKSPPGYQGRGEEYYELLRRGANRLMCETFHLEFTHKGGIYAWADSHIFDEFSGPLMKTGHFWKIHLGRRIDLEEDDLDGSVFIEDLLEDAVMFPMRVEGCRKTHERWETKEETRGVWVTRLMAHKEVPDEEDRCDTYDSDDGSECRQNFFDLAQDAALVQSPSAGGAIALNEYLSESGDEEDVDEEDDNLHNDEDDDQANDIVYDVEDGDHDNHDDNDNEESDNYDSPESNISDSEEEEVYDPSCQLATMLLPDRAWDPNEDDAGSEDEDYDELDDQE